MIGNIIYLLAQHIGNTLFQIAVGTVGLILTFVSVENPTGSLSPLGSNFDDDDFIGYNDDDYSAYYKYYNEDESFEYLSVYIEDYSNNLRTKEKSLSNSEVFSLRDRAFRIRLEGEELPQDLVNKLKELNIYQEVETLNRNNLNFLPLIDIDGEIFKTLSSAQFSEESLPQSHHYNDKKIIFQAAMETPLARVGGLGSFMRDYTKALKKRDDIEFFLLSPFFDFLKKEHEYAEFKGYIDHEVWGKRMRSTIYEVTEAGLTQYLIEPDPKCKRIFDILKSDRVYSSYAHSELSARILYFNSAIASMTASYRGESGEGHVDILHTHTWHTLISAIILNDKLNPLREKNNLPPVRVLNTIHMHAQGEGFLPKEFLEHVGITELDTSSKYYSGIKTKENLINILETGASYADVTNTVSPSLAEDMLDSELSLGVHETYRPLFQNNRFSGILNGMNRAAFDPRNENVLGEFTTKEDLSNVTLKKSEAKRALYDAGIIADPEKPLFLYVGRFGSEKGTALLGAISHQVAALGGQMVIMGPGHTTDLNEPQKLQRDGFDVRVYTDVKKDQLEELGNTGAKKGNLIRFAADYTVMPSYSEACGLVGLEALSMGSFLAASNAQGLKSACLPFDDDDHYEGENCVQFDITKGDVKAHVQSMIAECFEREEKLTGNEKALIQKWLIEHASAFDWNYAYERTGSMDRYHRIYEQLLGKQDAEFSSEYSDYVTDSVQHFSEHYPNLQFAIKSLLTAHASTTEFKQAQRSLEEAIKEELETCKSSYLSFFIGCPQTSLQERYEVGLANRINEIEDKQSQGL